MSNQSNITAVSKALANYYKEKTKNNAQQVDVVGIGIGPANLGLAALLEPVKTLQTVLFDKRENFIWHRGLLLPNAELQVSYLKDLVTFADPTNRLSFLNYLAVHKRLYQFITANFRRVTRQEFNLYYQWACRQLNNLHFNHTVKAVEQVGDKFLVAVEHNQTTNRVYTKNVVVGIGLQPYLPDYTKAHIGSTVFHASQFMLTPKNIKEKIVVVVGGGQTGAEIIKYFLNDQTNLPAKIIWLSRRENFLPLDESPFVNDLFTPSYSHYFYQLSNAKKQKLLQQQRLFSDGISPSTLEEIYRRLYELNFLEGKPDLCQLIPGTEVVALDKVTQGWQLVMRTLQTGEINYLNADMVVLSTGYQYQIPDFLTLLLPQINKDQQGNLMLNADFSLQLQQATDSKIYIQNGARHAYGIADPNLSLMAWRNAVIINSMTKSNVYPSQGQGAFINWLPESEHSPSAEVHYEKRQTI